ncbi:MAG: alkaline phosphatase PhoX [Micromonosporaceae bacterium]
MERRSFLRAATFGAGSVALGFTLRRDTLPQAGPSPYGALRQPDGNGVMLPNGFTSRVIARSGQPVVGTSHIWHGAPDGGACFADGAGWIYVSNSEIDYGAGGVSAVRLSSSGEITGARRLLSGTNRNCAGGATEWGTWLSCEEVDRGWVFETHPQDGRDAIRRDALGRFRHEAAAADPARKVIYLTEDEPDGCFYRFVPDQWGDLSSGTLQALATTRGGLSWKDVPDPYARSTRTRHQLAETIVFNGGEGACFSHGTCYFTTKGDNRIWAYHARRHRLTLAYQETGAAAPLTGVDNITGGPAGDLFVAEDSGDMQICVVTPDAVAAPFLRVTGHRWSEITGPAFNPAGDRLYFSSQRGAAGDDFDGVTYEVLGPFRRSPRRAGS